MRKNFNFDECPVIHAPAVYRAASVSPTAGNRILKEMRDAGRVAPQRTPTGRDLLTTGDARALFETITKA